MADNEARAQIDKLRKTRPARVIDASGSQLVESNLRDQLIAALAFLRDDLKEEIRLIEQAKIKGGVTLIKDRTAVSGWLELFVIQLGRECETRAAPVEPTERLSPSAELSEHRPSEFGTLAAPLPGPGGRCAVGNIHDEHTLKCACGYDVAKPITTITPSVVDLPALPPDALTYIGDTLIEQAVGADAGQTPAGIMSALGVDPEENATHAAVDKEFAHVTADPIVDPFAPIPTPAWTPSTPPGARKLTALDLLQPIDAALLPPHLSFSQATTVSDCGAKYRMQRVEQLPQVPQWANVGGKAFHACVELIEQNPTTAVAGAGWLEQFEQQIELTENEFGMPRQQFRASQQGKEGYDWWRVEGAAMLQRYMSWRQGSGAGQQVLTGPGGAPMLEWETTYDVDGVPFKTIIDSVWTNAHHDTVLGNAQPTAIIRDWKTGSMTPDDRQLCTQAWGLRKAGWQGPILAQFFDARKGTFSEPFDPLERMTWDDVRYFVLSADAQRRLPILPARPSDFCGGCSVAYACPIMAQHKAPKVVK